MQQNEDTGTQRADGDTFNDEFDEKFGKDRGDRRPAHAHQPQILSDAQCSQEITDIKHTLMGSLQKA